MEMSNIQLTSIKENDVKKAIVVIGQTGHGKSAFVKMLVKNLTQIKDKIKVSNSRYSVTKQCSLYEVEPSLKLSSEKLYILDTIGLYLKQGDNNCYVLHQKINAAILEYKLEIVSIVVVISSAERFGIDKLLNFIRYFKLRDQVKKNISFTVFSKYDTIIQDGQKDFQNQYQEFKQSMRRQKLEMLINKGIKWISKSGQMKDVNNGFQNVLKKQKNNKIYLLQHPILKNNIQKILNEKRYATFQKWKKDLQNFERRAVTNLENLLNLNQISTLQKQNIQFQILHRKVKENLGDLENYQNFFCYIKALFFPKVLNIFKNLTEQKNCIIIQRIQEYLKIILSGSPNKKFSWVHGKPQIKTSSKNYKVGDVFLQGSKEIIIGKEDSVKTYKFLLDMPDQDAFEKNLLKFINSQYSKI